MTVNQTKTTTSDCLFDISCFVVDLLFKIPKPKQKYEQTMKIRWTFSHCIFVRHNQNNLSNCSGVATGGSAAVGAAGGGAAPSNSLIPTLSLSLALIAATALVPVAVFPPFAT